MPRIAGSVRARPRCSLAWTNRSGLKMIMSNRYLSAMSRSTAPISEPGRISATAGTCSPRQPAARRADRHPDLRIAADPLDLAGGGVGLHQEPAVPLDEPHRGGDAPAVALVAGDTEVPAAEHGRGGGRLDTAGVQTLLRSWFQPAHRPVVVPVAEVPAKVPAGIPAWPAAYRPGGPAHRRVRNSNVAARGRS